ncbi:MAG: DUF433 domain-containing protein [Nitrospirae bacterium]|nr:DUF433 domain-containing protein [Nitrospirota bacterium]
MSTKITHPYITRRKDVGGGNPLIAGTRTRLSNIIAYYKLGFSPEDLAREFPHLSLAQIHDALSYYYEHQSEIDREIDEDSEDTIKKLLRK